MTIDTVRIQFTRFSAFYSPLIATICGGFLAAEGLAGESSVSKPGVSAIKALSEGEVDVVQSAPSQAFAFAERGEAPPALHFAQINCTDGFFLVGREPESRFEIGNLAGRRVIVDHGGQPLHMFRYACHKGGIDPASLEAIDAGATDDMIATFRAGEGDYIHLQGPAPQQLEADGVGSIVGRVGDWVGRCAFSSLASTPAWLAGKPATAFMRAFRNARQWVAEAPPQEIAESERSYFPDVPPAVLADTIAAYQNLGCWSSQVEIVPHELAVSIDVFRLAGVVSGEVDAALVAVAPPG